MTRWRDQGGRVSTEGTRPTRELRNNGDQHTITEMQMTLQVKSERKSFQSNACFTQKDVHNDIL
jgi:hypothetical protein